VKNTTKGKLAAVVGIGNFQRFVLQIFLHTQDNVLSMIVRELEVKSVLLCIPANDVGKMRH
jgi:hypothetical protein